MHPASGKRTNAHVVDNSPNDNASAARVLRYAEPTEWGTKFSHATQQSMEYTAALRPPVPNREDEPSDDPESSYYAHDAHSPGWDAKQPVDTAAVLLGSLSYARPPPASKDTRGYVVGTAKPATAKPDKVDATVYLARYRERCAAAERKQRSEEYRNALRNATISGTIGTESDSTGLPPGQTGDVNQSASQPTTTRAAVGSSWCLNRCRIKHLALHLTDRLGYSVLEIDEGISDDENKIGMRREGSDDSSAAGDTSSDDVEDAKELAEDEDGGIDITEYVDPHAGPQETDRDTVEKSEPAMRQQTQHQPTASVYDNEKLPNITSTPSTAPHVLSGRSRSHIDLSHRIDGVAQLRVRLQPEDVEIIRLESPGDLGGDPNCRPITVAVIKKIQGAYMTWSDASAYTGVEWINLRGRMTVGVTKREDILLECPPMLLGDEDALLVIGMIETSRAEAMNAELECLGTAVTAADKTLLFNALMDSEASLREPRELITNGRSLVSLEYIQTCIRTELDIMYSMTAKMQMGLLFALAAKSVPRGAK